MRSDISNSMDITILVNTFYSKVTADETIGPIFGHVNWNTHLPIMYSFWGSMLLGEASYRGNPLQRHMHLPLEAKHFSTWLTLWKTTIDELFAGPVAEEAKIRGDAIARVFQFKMGIKDSMSDHKGIVITEIK